MGRLPDAGAVQQQAAANPPKPSGAVATGALPKAAPSGAPDTNGTDAAPARGVPEVLDTATLYLQGKIVRLYGIEWARGAGEPEELSRYLKGREVVCRPTDSPESYRCEVDGQDLSKVVLYNGGGKATSDAPPELVAAQARAQSARIGVWSKGQKAEPAQ
jgi:endonuclease YncB( thermonuclease family)